MYLMGQHRASCISSVASIAFVLLTLIAADIRARPTTAYEAELVVTGWLADNLEPFGARLGGPIVDVETTTGAAGKPLYYVVHLSPCGFVVVPADDLVEPILAFTDAQTFELSAQDPLAALIERDVNRRLVEAWAGASGQLRVQSASNAQSRWYDLIGRAGPLQGEIRVLGKQTISDVRIAPFLKTRWSQDEICSRPGYNYYTPNHYLAGCGATAMAQLMYYYRYPVNGIGRHPFTIQVIDANQVVYTRGGDGTGGPYQWDDMVAVPDCDTTSEQRQAIGALCYDAGIAARTDYGRTSSSTDAPAVVAALRGTFGFSNAIHGSNEGGNIGGDLAGMINPNLDARYPVMLGIQSDVGHAVLVDGYGYDPSTQIRTLYHHLNMGWAGRSDMWYNLPDVVDFNTVTACIYNVFVEGKGEIISGRVIDGASQPIGGALITAARRTRTFVSVSDANGLYVLAKIPSATTYSIQVEKPGFTFTKQAVTTGTSSDGESWAGNKWAVDFTGRLIADSDNDSDVDFVDFARLASDWPTATATENDTSRAGGYLDLAALAQNWLAGKTPHKRP